MNNVDNTYPNLIDFKKNEIDTLAYLYTRGLLKDFQGLSSDIEQAHFYYSNLKPRQLAHEIFSFVSDFDFVVQKDVHRIVLGGQVTGTSKYELCTYFIGVCGKDDKSMNLIRKFHFDYAHPSANPNQAVPLFHMQYGGELAPDVSDRNITDDGIEGWLSVPRLNFAPMNLALLLDMFLCEFWTIDINSIIEDSTWRDLIYKNEALLLKGYYGSAADHFRSAGYSKLKLGRDFFYGR